MGGGPAATVGAVKQTLDALAAAVDRRSGWPARDAAAEALGVLHGDAARLAGLREAQEGVAGRFGLGPVEERLVPTSLLAEVHPAGHLLLGLLSGDDGAARPTVGLALELAGHSLADAGVAAQLAPVAAARRYGLLTFTAPDRVLLARRVRLADRAVAHLVGDDSPSSTLSALLCPAVPVATEGTEVVAAALAAGEPIVWVRSGAGGTGAALAVAACQQLDVLCVLADLRRAPEGADPREVVRELVLEAALTGRVLVLTGADRAAPAMDLLTTAPVPVVAVAESSWDPAWDHDLPTVVDAPRLTVPERRLQWRTALAGVEPGPEVVALRMTPEEIHTIGRSVRRNGQQPTTAQITATARRLGRPGTRNDASAATARLEDLVLPEHTRTEIQRLVRWSRHRDEVLAIGQLHGKGGKGSGITALFSGSPGTGKTLAAHVVAEALGMELFQVDLSSIVDKYIGETEKNLEKVFAEAEALNCVLFFDEADALFGSRSEVKDSRDRYANQEVAYLLQRMESFDGITVLATNLRGNLDKAFARRLHFMIHFPDPDAATRATLWRHHLAELPGLDPEDPVDVEELAEHLELAGGDIRNIVLAATYEAVAESRSVRMADLRRAAVREYTKLGRRIPAGFG